MVKKNEKVVCGNKVRNILIAQGKELRNRRDYFLKNVKDLTKLYLIISNHYIYLKQYNMKKRANILQNFYFICWFWIYKYIAMTSEYSRMKNSRISLFLPFNYPYVFKYVCRLPWRFRWWRICLQFRRPGFDTWFGKILWKRAWQPTPVFLPGESSWTEEPGRLQSKGSHRKGHDWATNYKHKYVCGHVSVTLYYFSFLYG